MQKDELSEAKKFVKKLAKLKKIKKEGSDSSAVGAYSTPKAFVGDSNAEGSAKATGANGTTYIVKPKKEKRFFIGYKNQGESIPNLNEASYKTFKEDTSKPDYKKVNEAILSINRKINEINQILKHSVKLKTEAQVGNEQLWKRTNEALLKMQKRLSEASKRVKEVANLKEIEANALKDRMFKILQLAKAQISLEDIEIVKRGNVYNIDVRFHGEPIAFDLENDILTYQDFDKEVELGNINREQDIVAKLDQVL